jgi:hypothetical protein
MQPSSYCNGPIVQGRLLTHHSWGWHGDEEGLRWWFPSPAGFREELLDPPDLGTTTVAACSMFCGKVFVSLGFFHQREFIGGRAMSGGGPGVHTTWWRGQRVAHVTLWCDYPLLWTPSSCQVNRNFGFHFVQFREYFLCKFCETQKQQKIGNWHYGISLIG